MIKFIATPTLSEDIKPGQLFSVEGPDYWDAAALGLNGQLGEKVYLRTAAATPPHEVGQEMYVITTEDRP